MKKFYLILLLLFISNGVNSQTFTDKDLQNNVLKINTATSSSDYEALYKKFSTANTSEKWQAYFYAGVSQYLKTEVLLKKSPAQTLVESNALALKYAGSIVGSQPNNADLKVLLGLIRLQRIQLNASPDLQKDTQIISQLITEAQSLSPNNPRLSILKSRFSNQFPGNNFNDMNAEQHLAKAGKDFESETTPNWGRQLLSITK